MSLLVLAIPKSYLNDRDEQLMLIMHNQVCRQNESSILNSNKWKCEENGRLCSSLRAALG